MKVLPYILGGLAASIVAAVVLVSYAPVLELIPYTVDLFYAGTALLVLITVLSIWKEDTLSEGGKKALMIGFLVATIVPTAYTLTAYTHTMYTSWSGGEVHWHADYEVIIQEDGRYKQLDLIDPGRFCEETEHESSYMCSLNDRVGETEYHEHNDRRIHLEGTFKDRDDASLRSFFRTFGGDLTDSSLRYPTNEQVYDLQESGNKTLKTVMKTGVGGSRGWCVIGDSVPEKDRCINTHTGEPVTAPSEYIISPIQRGPVDTIWIVFDTASAADVLADLREDDGYKQFTMEKTGEGY